MEAFTEIMISWGRRMIACHGVTRSLSRELEGRPEEMVVVTFQESSDKIEATDLEETSEETEATVEWQEQINTDAVESLGDQYDDQRLAVRRLQGGSGPKKSIIRRAAHEGHGCKRPGKVSLALGLPKRRTLEMGRWTGHNEIWDLDSMEQLLATLTGKSMAFSVNCTITHLVIGILWLQLCLEHKVSLPLQQALRTVLLVEFLAVPTGGHFVLESFIVTTV
jgi:hypothetical protein